MKILHGLTALCVSLALVSCNKDKTESPAKAPEQTSEEPPVTPPVAAKPAPGKPAPASGYDPVGKSTQDLAMLFAIANSPMEDEFAQKAQKDVKGLISPSHQVHWETEPGKVESLAGEAITQKFPAWDGTSSVDCKGATEDCCNFKAVIADTDHTVEVCFEREADSVYLSSVKATK